MSAVKKAVAGRLSYLRRELEIAERESGREPFDVSFLPIGQREPFEVVNAEIEAARNAAPVIRAEIEELTIWLDTPSP
jgi:hypothetical protein